MRKLSFIVPNTATGHQLILKCKDLRIVQLEIANGQDFVSVATSIEKLSSVTAEDLKLHYGFFYRPMYSLLENGFTMFRCVDLYADNIWSNF